MTIDQNLTPNEPAEGQATETVVASDAPVANATVEAETTPAVAEESTTPAEEPSAPAAVEPAPVAEEATPVVAEVAAAPVVEEVAPAVTEVAEPAVAEVAAPPVSQPVRAETGDADLFEQFMSGEFQVDGDPQEGGYRRLSKGERIEATIIQVDKDKVFVDLGTKSEGIVPLSELSEESLESAKDHFKVGDKINVVVLRPEGAEGNPIVSKKRADFEEIWDRIEAAHRTQEVIQAPVVDRVKGGLVVDVGVRGFVPATHVGSGKLRNIEKYVGTAVSFKVIEIDRDRRKVVLSNRLAEEERKAEAKEQIFSDVKPGDIIEGSVRRLTDYGAFVDLGGVDGLLHISEMSWARINHPKEMFKEGQKIKVMVLRLDSGAGKISLGHRQVLPDPWNLIKENYKNGQKMKVTISRIVQSGAFIKLPENAEAFLPVSEMSYRRIKRPQDVIEEGQETDVQIIDLRPDERRMVLSMKAVGGGTELRPGASVAGSGYEEDMRRADRGKPRASGPGAKGKKGGRGRDDFDEVEEISGRRGFATGGATIGERLGALKGMFTQEEGKEEPKVEEV